MTDGVERPVYGICHTFFCLSARALSVYAALLGMGTPDRGATEALVPTFDTEACMLGLAVGIDAMRWKPELELRNDFADYATLGVSWLRTDLNWGIIQAAGPASFDWTSMDRIVDLAAEHSIEVLPVVGSTPPWAWKNPDEPSPPANVSDYASFLTAAVARYRPRGIRAWEIWNEPNLSGPWPPAPDPVAYARLLQAAHAAIKAADPNATVISGGLAAAPTTGPFWKISHYSAVDFLEIIYSQGAGDAFDAVGFHPYSYPLMPDDPVSWNGWSLMAGPIREVMESHGDADKTIWITEYGAPTNEGEAGVSEADQAEMLTRGQRMALGYPWAGPVFWYSYRDLGSDPANNEDWFGLVRQTSKPKPSYSTFQSLAANCHAERVKAAE